VHKCILEDVQRACVLVAHFDSVTTPDDFRFAFAIAPAALHHATPRHAQIRFMVLPDMLKNAPMFKRVEAQKAGKKAVNLGVGRGRAAAMRAAGGGSFVRNIFYNFFFPSNPSHTIPSAGGRGRAGGPGGARGRGRGF
jgi:hypothetical protein